MNRSFPTLKAALAAAFVSACAFSLCLVSCADSTAAATSSNWGTDDASYTESSFSSNSYTSSPAVNFSDMRQRIDGFGGSNAWTSTPSDGTVVKKLFSRTDGIGLSILRNRIPFRESSVYDDKFVAKKSSTYVRNDDYKTTTNSNGTKNFTLDWSNWDLKNTKNLIAAIKALDGAPEDLVLMSTPWTPPNNSVSLWKTGCSDIASHPEIGGVLDPGHYADYGDLLADYANGFEANMGEPLDVLSVQNEPTWVPSYESCLWTAVNIRDFLVILGNRFALKDVSSSLKVIAPEDENFEEDMVAPSLLLDSSRKVLGLVGVHQYDFNETNYAAKYLSTVKSYGKGLWMTEVSSGSTNDATITDGLFWANVIHADMTVANVNAFLYWWLWNSGTTKSCLVTMSGTTPSYNKRLYTLGQFSRYIRPGWVRVGATVSPVTSVCMTACRNPDSTDFAIVLINNASSSSTVAIALSGATGLSSLAATRTSATEDMATITAPTVTSTSTSISVSLSASSVTTLYGAYIQ